MKYKLDYKYNWFFTLRLKRFIKKTFIDILTELKQLTREQKRILRYVKKFTTAGKNIMKVKLKN